MLRYEIDTTNELSQSPSNLQSDEQMEERVDVVLCSTTTNSNHR